MKKRVLIGGIGGGIGLALAKILSQQGCRVAGFGRDEKKLEKVRDAIPKAGVQVVEATDSDSLRTGIGGLLDTLEGVDVYVHAIGSVFLKPMHSTRESEFRDVLETNLVSAYLATQQVLGPMRKQKSGLVLMVSSVAAGIGLANHEAIAAAKGGIEGLIRSISASYASAGIRANGVAPGLVETDATRLLTSSEQAKTFSERMHPLGRIGTAGEVASLLAWLASEEATWVTGQIFGIDGGMGSIVPKPRA